MGRRKKAVDWLSRLVRGNRRAVRRPPASKYPAPRAEARFGFAEAGPPGLHDLEARLPPPGTETQPAWTPRPKHNDRLDPSQSAGGGYVRGADGTQRPHYWGHRERLRSRFLSGGHAPMPEYELLELLLFNAIPRIDVKPLAKRLLAEFGDLNGVVAASERNLLRVEGATDRVWLQLRIVEAFAHRMSQAKVLDREVLSSWSDVVSYCRTTMAHRQTEQFRVLFLDRKNVVIADEAQGEGTVDHVPVYPREVARRALELSASALLIVHNHPSGDPTPSEADIEMTLRLEAACGALGIVIHDHLIIGKDKELSFRSTGLMGTMGID
ncbi:DNA repair protein RadC [Jannaschia seosinensis]|uniref:DNA repair protein RadC n=1 Tax=Jannaschia seosinensis TaxID=313367 RepID=A0A0M7BD86_9RHOB|nr:DNA repair protein RadC [Jannaschia seosinensis]CUH40139.1 DNA repair protein RadC [Jannaschia seosinensis]